MIQTIEKPWGKEEILESNKKYLVKRLTMNPYSQCSLQYHVYKQETIYVLEGHLYILIDKEFHMYAAGDFVTIEPGIIHRMSTEEYRCVYLESSTAHPNDVVRLEDAYGRA